MPQTLKHPLQQSIQQLDAALFKRVEEKPPIDVEVKDHSEGFMRNETSIVIRTSPSYARTYSRLLEDLGIKANSLAWIKRFNELPNIRIECRIKTSAIGGIIDELNQISSAVARDEKLQETYPALATRYASLGRVDGAKPFVALQYDQLADNVTMAVVLEQIREERAHAFKSQIPGARFIREQLSAQPQVGTIGNLIIPIPTDDKQDTVLSSLRALSELSLSH